MMRFFPRPRRGGAAGAGLARLGLVLAALAPLPALTAPAVPAAPLAAPEGPAPAGLALSGPARAVPALADPAPADPALAVPALAGQALADPAPAGAAPARTAATALAQAAPAAPAPAPGAPFAVAPAPAPATPAAAVPVALRGAWFGGDCAAPTAMLHLTARAAARLPEDGPARLIRFAESRPQGDWLVGTGRGAEAPRILLRAAGTGLQSAEPDAKLRDDHLPGATPLQSWHRCPTPPAAFAALHGEGLAFMATLEVLEAACGSPGATPAACAAAIVAEGDVSGDRLLSPAEIARLARGAAWVMATAEDAAPEAVLAAGGGAVLGGVALGRFAVESLDYDGDGKLSAAELGQDRAAFARATGSEGGRPLRLEGVQEGIGLLRSLVEGMIFGQ
jgi:hypothetical protein